MLLLMDYHLIQCKTCFISLYCIQRNKNLPLDVAVKYMILVILYTLSGAVLFVHKLHIILINILRCIGQPAVISNVQFNINTGPNTFKLLHVDM